MEGEIAYDVFVKAVASTPFSQKLREKAKWLVENFACMTDERPVHKNVHHSAVRPKKIGADREVTVKSITTLMNKLTSSNKEHIISQVRKSFRPDSASTTTQTIWNFMLLCPDHQDAYADVLIMLTPHVSEHIYEIWEKYINNKDWLIKELDLSGYDDFCEHVKLKKRALSTITAFGALCRKRILDYPSTILPLVEILRKECDDAIINYDPALMKKLELLLDEFTVAVAINMSHYANIHHDVCKWMEIATSSSILPPVIRFKIYDINDKCTQQMAKKK